MAEFCKQCAEDMGFDPDYANLFHDRGITPTGKLGFNVLCEGCGMAFIIDDEGTCDADDCIHEHGKHSG